MNTFLESGFAGGSSGRFAREWPSPSWTEGDQAPSGWIRLPRSVRLYSPAKGERVRFYEFRRRAANGRALARCEGVRYVGIEHPELLLSRPEQRLLP